MARLSDLKKGQRGIIKDFDAAIPQTKLLEIGCLPGNEVEVVQKAFFSDPVCIRLNGVQFAIRKSEAAQIEIAL